MNWNVLISNHCFTKMSSYTIVKNILKAQNEDLLNRIAAEFDLDADELKAKYLRPTFYLPDVREEPAIIQYTTILKTTRKKKKQGSDGGASVSGTTREDS